MNQPKRKRRRFTFSLRALLIFMLLLACLFGWIGICYRRGLEQQAILDRIRAKGAIYIGDDERRPNSLYLFFDGNFINRIDGVVYFDTDLSPTDFSLLAELKNLEDLRLNSTQVSDFTPLAGLKNLQVLYFWDTPATDLSPLSGLKNLQELYLYNTRVTDLSPVAGLKNLKELSLYETQVTDLLPLAKMKNLRKLELTYYPPSCVGPPAKLRKLQELWLNDRVDDQDIERLKKELPNCHITY